MPTLLASEFVERLMRVDRTPCKCCGADAAPCGDVDFNKSCEDHRGAPLGRAGIPIRYHRCAVCGFVFTVAFDAFSASDFSQFIYNDEYASVDPDFAVARPRSNAEFVLERILRGERDARVLDFGGGNGGLAMLLRSAGVKRAETYDPFYAGKEGKPAGTFDLVTCFEVMEHTPQPAKTLKELRWLVDEKGMLFFSTLLQPADYLSQGLAWWYAAPRNGHISLYSRQSMDALMNAHGLRWESFNDAFHVAYRKRLPSFAEHLRGK